MTKHPTRKKQKPQPKPKQPHTHKTLRWAATEANKHRRWWWWLAVGYISLTLTTGLIAFGQWTAAILSLVIFIMLIVVYGAKPRRQTYVLKGAVLTIDKLQLDLARYDRFIIDEPPAGRDDATPDISLQLLPKAFFGLSHTVLLPKDPGEAEAVLLALDAQVPFKPDDPYAKSSRRMQRMARWLRVD